MQSVVDVYGTEHARSAPERTQRRKERRGVGAAAEGDAQRQIREARQQLGEAPAEPAGAEFLGLSAHRPAAGQAAFSENTPKEAIFAARAARS
jgi:hypothetical protein